MQNTMTRTIFLLVCVLLFSNTVNGQSDNACIEETEVEKVLPITPNSSFSVHLNIKICNDEDNNIILKLSRSFWKGQSIIKGEKIQKQGQKLFILNTRHDSYDIFSANINTPPGPAEEIKDTVLYAFAAIADSTWMERSITFTFGCKYLKGSKEQIKAIRVRFILPDNINLAESSEEGSLIDSLASDSIETVDAELSKATSQKKVEQTRTSTKKATDIEEGACIDSLRFYLKKINSLYGSIDRYENLKENDQELIKNKFENYTSSFNTLFYTCKSHKGQQLKEDFDRISKQVIKRIYSASDAESRMASEDDLSVSDTQESNKEPFQFKNLLVYLFAALFVILLLLYIYPKIKKKLKK